MPNVFNPRLENLPAPQKRLWPELAQTPDHFILYGGTAIALRLGHRPSVDFDFYVTDFNPLLSLKAIAYHDVPTLMDLPQHVRRDLIAAVKATDIHRLPALNGLRT